MSALPAFDTLTFARRLSAAGMETRQAEALAEALQDAIFGNVATKGDLRELELSLKGEIREHRAETQAMEQSLRAETQAMEQSLRGDMKDMEQSLRSDMKDMEIRLMTRMGAMIGFSTAITITVLGALISFIR